LHLDAAFQLTVLLLRQVGPGSLLQAPLDDDASRGM